MENILYKDVECIWAKETKTLFVKQSNGIKFSKIGAIFFDDDEKIIEHNKDIIPNYSNYDLQHSVIDKLSLICNNVEYTKTNDKILQNNNYNINYTTNDYYLYKVNTKQNMENNSVIYEIDVKYNTFNIINMDKDTINVDGIILYGLPFKSLEKDNANYYINQKYAVLSILYFPDKPGEDAKNMAKIKTLYEQPHNITMSIQLNYILNDYLTLDVYKDLDKNKRLNGFHLTNDGEHNRIE
jgi:hypothetical protein